MVPAAGSTQESSDPDTQRQRGHADTHVIRLTQDRRAGLTKDVQRLYSVGRRRSCSTISIQLPSTACCPSGWTRGTHSSWSRLMCWTSFDRPFRSMKLADRLPPVCQECAKTRNNEP
jgi:hypothetical protein